MILIKLMNTFSICKLDQDRRASIEEEPFFFASRTDDELSIVCKTEKVPKDCLDQSDGWRGFKIDGILDFSLIGILSEISTILAKNKIGIFVISTFNTDYIFVKEENYQKSIDVLSENQYEVK